MCYIGLSIHSERRTTRTHGQLRCVHSTPADIFHFSYSLFDFISASTSAKSGTLEIVKLFLYLLLTTGEFNVWCNMCQAGCLVYRFGTSQSGNLLISFVKFFHLVPSPSVLLLHFGWSFFFWDLVFRKLESRKEDCVAPSWCCWVMTAPFIRRRIPIPAQFRGLYGWWSSTLFSRPLSPVPVLCSHPYTFSIQLIRSLRWEKPGPPYTKNILGNCVLQRTWSPPSTRTLLIRRIILIHKKGNSKDQPRRRIRGDFIYMNILPPLYYKL